MNTFFTGAVVVPAALLMLLGACVVIVWVSDRIDDIHQWRMRRRYRNLYRKSEFPRADIRAALRRGRK